MNADSLIASDQLNGRHNGMVNAVMFDGHVMTMDAVTQINQRFYLNGSYSASISKGIFAYWADN